MDRSEHLWVGHIGRATDGDPHLGLVHRPHPDADAAVGHASEHRAVHEVVLVLGEQLLERLVCMEWLKETPRPGNKARGRQLRFLDGFSHGFGGIIKIAEAGLCQRLDKEHFLIASSGVLPQVAIWVVCFACREFSVISLCPPA